MTRIGRAVRRFLREEEGAALAEYGILIAFIAIAAIVAVTFFGTREVRCEHLALDAIPRRQLTRERHEQLLSPGNQHQVESRFGVTRCEIPAQAFGRAGDDHESSGRF